MIVSKHYEKRPDGKTLIYPVKHLREVSAGRSYAEGVRR